eukprot:COSAG01_NODE_51341_length_355_cov_1.382812_1_plen_45_part_10
MMPSVWAGRCGCPESAQAGGGTPSVIVRSSSFLTADNIWGSARAG